MVHQQSPAAHYQHKQPPWCDLQRFTYRRLQQIVQRAGSMRSITPATLVDSVHVSTAQVKKTPTEQTGRTGPGVDSGSWIATDGSNTGDACCDTSSSAKDKRHMDICWRSVGVHSSADWRPSETNSSGGAARGTTMEMMPSFISATSGLNQPSSIVGPKDDLNRWRLPGFLCSKKEF